MMSADRRMVTLAQRLAGLALEVTDPQVAQALRELADQANEIRRTFLAERPLVDDSRIRIRSRF